MDNYIEGYSFKLDKEYSDPALKTIATHILERYPDSITVPYAKSVDPNYRLSAGHAIATGAFAWAVILVFMTADPPRVFVTIALPVIAIIVTVVLGLIYSKTNPKYLDIKFDKESKILTWTVPSLNHHTHQYVDDLAQLANLPELLNIIDRHRNSRAYNSKRLLTQLGVAPKQLTDKQQLQDLSGGLSLAPAYRQPFPKVPKGSLFVLDSTGTDLVPVEDAEEVDPIIEAELSAAGISNQ